MPDHDGYPIGNRDNSRRGRGVNARNLRNQGKRKWGCPLSAAMILTVAGMAAYVAYRVAFALIG